MEVVRKININKSDIYGFIYKITNMINGKCYIGQKKLDNGSRWKNYMGGGQALQYSMKKHGKENFIREIIAITKSEEESNKLESEYIEYFNAVRSEDYYNMIDGGVAFDVVYKVNRKPVICLDTGVIFHSIDLASEYTGKKSIYIRETFNKKHTFNGFYEEDMIFRRMPISTEVDRLCCICGSAIKFYKTKPVICCNIEEELIKNCLCDKCMSNKLVIDLNLKKHCEMCGSLIVNTNAQQKYCTNCSKLRNNKNKRERIMEIRNKLKSEIIIT